MRKEIPTTSAIEDLECDFCRGKLKNGYAPINSRRGVTVYLCEHCGLFQSFTSGDYESRPAGSMSCDADRSSYRYTKDLMLPAYKGILQSEIPLDEVESVLDIGSSRGTFLKWISSFPKVERLFGIEPDPEVVGSYEGLANARVVADRFENVDLGNETFDLIYSIHTLEHLPSAWDALLRMRSLLADGGFLFLAVPRISFHDDLIEELFIDPHLYHFTKPTLLNGLAALGFDVQYCSDDSYQDVVVVAKKGAAEAGGRDAVSEHPSIAALNAEYAKYRDLLAKNRLEVGADARQLTRLKESGEISHLVIWGGGRIFDALLKFGDLNTDLIDLLVDKFLWERFSEFEGIEVRAPEALSGYPPETTLVYVASRNFAEEISKEARAMGFSKIMIFGKSRNED